ncbi:hypothetical protein DFJ74DRAFT_714167 [Hyaloraphidium curvatum]|nr:hypothetical protein DFJ74DRAFT_714167 [Hyaloraphidium curvatum]
MQGGPTLPRSRLAEEPAQGPSMACEQELHAARALLFGLVTDGAFEWSERGVLAPFFLEKQGAPATALPPEDVAQHVLGRTLQQSLAVARRYAEAFLDPSLRTAWGFPTVEQMETCADDLTKGDLGACDPTPFWVLLWIPTMTALLLVKGAGLSQPLRKRIADEVSLLDTIALCGASNPALVLLVATPDWPTAADTRTIRGALDLTYLLVDIVLPFAMQKPKPWRRRLRTSSS